MGLSTLPPLKAVRIPSILVQHQQQKGRKYRTSRHHYLLRMRKEESLRMRRLGSGLLEHAVLDSTILTHLVSLLDSQRGCPFILGGATDLQDIDGSSPRGSVFSSKRPSLAIPGAKPYGERRVSRGTWTTMSDTGGREFPEDAPPTASRGPLSSDSSSMSSVPQLPSIARPRPMSPIKDVSRETTQHLLTLPSLQKEGQESLPPNVHVMPATPQHSTLTDLPSLRTQHLNDNERCLSEASGYNMSSDSSVMADPSLIFARRSSRQPKGSRRQQGGGQTRSSVESPSLRGSMIMAPDGEIIQVGGTIAPSRPHDVGVFRDVSSQLRLYDGGMLTDDSGLSDEEGEEWRETGRGSGRKPKRTSSKAKAGKKHPDKGRSSVTEQDIVETLAEQAKQIADALLERDEAGVDLERDIREAADLWMESHPVRDISHQQDPLQSAGALEELMAAYRDSSADPTAPEYRHLIRQALITAVANAAGLSPDRIPEDLQVSPDLLGALANQQLSVEDVFIAYDEVTGRPFLRSRQEIALNTEGGDESGQPALSSFGQDLDGGADGALLMSSTAYDAIQPEEDGSLIDAASPRAEDDQKLTDLLKATEAGAVPTAPFTDQGAGTGVQKPGSLLRDTAAASAAAAVAGATAGNVDAKAELLKDLAATAASAAGAPAEGKSRKTKKEREGKKKGRKGRKSKKDDDSERSREGGGGEGEGSPLPGLSRVKDAATASSSEDPGSPNSQATPSSVRSLQSSPEPGKSDEDSDFTRAKRKKEGKTEAASPLKPEAPLPFPDDDDDDDEDDDSEEKSQANREARAARRAAAAAKRKEEVERRRREREEQLKLTKGELERQEQLKREMEMERLRREEEKLLRKLQEREEAEREERELEEERMRRMEEEERERQEMEEHQRRLDEMRREQMEEEERRNALLRAQEREEERRRAEEELMLSQMAEQERLEYQRRKREEEEARKRREEEERRQREEESRRALEEARRLAEEMSRKQAALEAKLRFNRSLRREARNLGHSQQVNRAFVFSYFQLMQWLGLDLDTSLYK